MLTSKEIRDWWVHVLWVQKLILNIINEDSSMVLNSFSCCLSFQFLPFTTYDWCEEFWSDALPAQYCEHLQWHLPPHWYFNQRAMAMQSGAIATSWLLCHSMGNSLRLGYLDDSKELDGEREEETECELPYFFLLLLPNLSLCDETWGDKLLLKHWCGKAVVWSGQQNFRKHRQSVGYRQGGLHFHQLCPHTCFGILSETCWLEILWWWH